ncbi:MAG TPA: hypothetical protein VEI02_02255 [Planctomycetota bacterium]|nr:hypothetical protein [Planctomycetota bacterium]
MKAPLARFAPVKLNLFLEVLSRRADGYHEISTVMETVAHGDTVIATAAYEGLTVTADRDDVPSGPENVAWKIVRAAERELGRPLPAHVEIAKRVAPGTGLGAGSSDAAAALDAVLATHDFRVDADVRRRIAAKVGSDVPFFVEGGLAWCTGRGEVVRPLARRGVRHVVLALGGPTSPTPAVYARVRPPERPVDPAPWLEALARGATLADGDGPAPFNRLADAAEEAVPELAERRRALATAARREPFLAGSGGTHVFLCATQAAAADLADRLTVDAKRLGGPFVHVASFTGAPTPEPA